MKCLHAPALLCVGLGVSIIGGMHASLASNHSIVTSDAATGLIAAQASDDALRFVDHAVGVEWTGGDALRLPQGQGALARLTGHVPFRQLVSAGEAAFNGQGFDRLLVVGTEMADRALRLAERPGGLRLQGSTRRIRGMTPNGRFFGRGLSLALGAARSLSTDIAAGMTFGLERSQIRGGDDRLFSRGWTAAAQLGWQAAPELILELSAGASLVDRTLRLDHGTVTASPNAHRAFVALHADHNWERNNFRLSPSATLSLTTEAQNPFTDSSGTSHDDTGTQYGRATGGMEVGYRFDLGHGDIDVYGNIHADWDFLRTGGVTLTPMRWDEEAAARATIATGLTLTSDAGFASNLEVRNDAIGSEGFNRTTLHASVQLHF